MTFVRDDDNEYDVQYEDGTVFTIKAKDVKRQTMADKSAKKTATPSRSRSRGRSPARKKSPARTPAKTKSPASKSTAATRSSRRSAATVQAPKPDATPTRTSARIAAKVELSSDEDDSGRRKSYAASRGRGGGSGGIRGAVQSVLSTFHWVPTAVLAVMGPLIMLSLHELCKDGSCKLAMPKLSKKPADYWNPQAFGFVFVVMNLFRLLSYIPVGNSVRATNGNTVRMNGFVTLLGFLAVFPALWYRKVDISFVTKNFYHLMTSCLIMSVVSATFAYVKSRWARKSALNPKGNTGNIIVDFYYGREFNPSNYGTEMKLQAFRASMYMLALLNVCLVLQSVIAKGGAVNFAVVMTGAFQIIFALDALYFEEYYFFSHDAMNSGFGFSLTSSYFAFPFVPTLITRYVIARNPTLTALQLVSIGALNALGYVIFRSSETNRCEMAKNPSNPALRHLDAISAVGGKRILCSGWWGLVRHPNYLGQILMEWSWVMPAGKSIISRNRKWIHFDCKVNCLTFRGTFWHLSHANIYHLSR